MADKDSEQTGDDAANGNGSATSATGDITAQLDKAKSDYLYLLADFDNYRKNSIKERSDLVKFGAERMIRDLLGVLDNFELALENQSNQEKFQEGVKMIHQELKTFLQRYGVSEMPAEGLAFDPGAHEALSQEPTAAVPPGHVARVFKKAYKLHDRLIRPAQVVVAVAPPEPTENNNG